MLTCHLTVFSTPTCFDHTHDSVANVSPLRSGLRQNYYLLLVMLVVVVVVVVKLMVLVVMMMVPVATAMVMATVLDIMKVTN